MAQIYFPSDIVMVPADGHGKGYQYRVSVGHEAWDGGMVLVGKVQIVDDAGKVLGRQAPSFPSQGEYQAVHSAMASLLAKLPETVPPRATGQ